MEEVIELIKSTNEKLSGKIPELNRGGCGVYASLMFKQLKQLGYTPKIVIFNRGDIETKKETLNNLLNNNKVKEYQKSDTSFPHCCLKLQGVYFDGHELGKGLIRSWGHYQKGEYSIDELDIALKVGGWNGRYNRRKRNPTLKAVIRNTVKEIFN